MPEGNHANRNGLTPKRTPTDSHQPPQLTFIIYLNMTLTTGSDRKVQGLPEKNTTRGTCVAGGEGGDFFTSRRSEPLQLSIPQARNFVVCLSI